MASLFDAKPDGFYGHYTGDDGKGYTIIKKTITNTSKFKGYGGIQSVKSESYEFWTDDGKDVTPHVGDKMKIVMTGVILTPNQ